jgi:hypothetical protein
MDFRQLTFVGPDQQGQQFQSLTVNSAEPRLFPALMEPDCDLRIGMQMVVADHL